ncbi:heme ABC exporter ATP-binding protein CcmA [Enhygromyxa salina]|uniref:Fluoroquinolones export ATP-binding protein n=1 Tax=Enhygromyxa salina TaxID=215803 RepID=A0A2S9YIR2_9BACT|nr:heme ABC exporter ATP-binding protein CcmA [Enhygromyxa salina]PRQ04932.1 Fluoroquinolones export ATP-binding protein [Enhygromyxa salina]
MNSTASQASILPVELRGVTCRFGRKAVLRGVEMELRAGEIVGLLGQNGAGKTTLFTILVGLRQGDAGARLFGGVERREVELEIRARLAWLAHDPQLYPLLSARENVELFVDLAGSTRPSGAPTPRAVLERLGLADVIDRPVGTFSRGMAQRVALARALALEPELLILDEPFTALDRAGRELLADLLRAEAARGAAVLLSSHDLDVVAELVDRALLLDAGVIALEVQRERGQTTDEFRRRLSASL